MANLTGAQIEQLHSLILRGYNARTLHHLVRFKLDLDLFDELAAERQPFSNVAFDAICPPGQSPPVTSQNNLQERNASTPGSGRNA